MANTRVLQQSFIGGEVSPNMFGRIEDPYYRNGLSECLNFVVRPDGSVENRAGFEFVRAARNDYSKARLIPFQFSNDQSFAIEMGVGYFRFHTNGATLLNDDGQPYEISSPYNENEIFDVHYVQSGDVMTLVHRNHFPCELRRLSATKWEFKPIRFGATISTPIGVTGFAHKGGDAGNPNKVYYDTQYCVTAVSNDGLNSESETSTVITLNNNVFVTGNHNRIEWQAVEGAGRYKVYKRTSGIFGYIGQTKDLFFIDDNIAADTSITPPIYDNIFLQGGIDSFSGIQPIEIPNYGKITSPQIENKGNFESILPIGGGNKEVFTDTPFAAFKGLLNSRRLETFKIALEDATGRGASLSLVFSGYKLDSIEVLGSGDNYSDPKLKVYKKGLDADGGEIWEEFTGFTPAVIKWNLIQNFTITIEDEEHSGSGAAAVPVFDGRRMVNVAITSRGYNYKRPILHLKSEHLNQRINFASANLTQSSFPSAVSYFQQRRVFAGTSIKPLQVWMTKTGTESNLSYSLPIKDDDRISFKLASREASMIQHIVPLNKMILMTGSAEWNVNTLNTDYLTPTSISVSPQSYIGSSMVQPVIANNSLIYAAARGGHVRELAYNWQANGYITGDISIRSSHLFDGKKVMDMCLQKSPFPVVWCVSSDGSLLGLTYLPEQNIGAWHKHTTDGVVESITTVTEQDDDILYAVIKRTVQGRSVRHIERMRPRKTTTQKDYFFMDGGLTYRGTPVGAVSGLSALEGKTVQILADGNVMPKTVVSSGSVNLPDGIEASVISVGLPIDYSITTLPLAFQIDAAMGQGRNKNIGKVWLRVYGSSAISAGRYGGKMYEYKQRTTEVFSQPNRPKTGVVEINIDGQWDDDGLIQIKQENPLPLTVLSMTAEFSVG